MEATRTPAEESEAQIEKLDEVATPPMPYSFPALPDGLVRVIHPFVAMDLATGAIEIHTRHWITFADGTPVNGSEPAVNKHVERYEVGTDLRNFPQYVQDFANILWNPEAVAPKLEAQKAELDATRVTVVESIRTLQAELQKQVDKLHMYEELVARFNSAQVAVFAIQEQLDAISKSNAPQ